jgi:hypothetical protein
MRAAHVRRSVAGEKETPMKRKLVPLLIALLVVAALALGSRILRADTGTQNDKTEKAAPDVTLRGIVVDMHCFVTHGTLDVLFGETPHSVKATGRTWPTFRRR